MDTVLSQDRLRSIYDQSARIVTEQTSGILLVQSPIPLHRDICTLYTNFERCVHSGLAMCADTSLFTRLTQNMMHIDEVDARDVEDFAKEYFNVLCGHIAAALFRDTKLAARFQIPVFYRGWYQPANQQESWELSFLSDKKEGARLIHYKSPTA